MSSVARYVMMYCISKLFSVYFNIKERTTKKDDLIRLMQRSGGRITTKAARKEGFSNTLLSLLVNRGIAEQESRGVYALADTPLDDYAVIALRWPKVVFSYNSALFLHGLSDRPPSSLDVTMPRGYNAKSLTEEYPTIRIHFSNIDRFGIGLDKASSPTGTIISLYDKERCICDVLKAHRQGKIDTQVFSDALRTYFSSRNKNLPKLARFARELSVAEDLIVYSEVLA